MNVFGLLNATGKLHIVCYLLTTRTKPEARNLLEYLTLDAPRMNGATQGWFHLPQQIKCLSFKYLYGSRERSRVNCTNN
jgi:hypothetical protein